MQKVLLNSVYSKKFYSKSSIIELLCEHSYSELLKFVQATLWLNTQTVDKFEELLFLTFQTIVVDYVKNNGLNPFANALL